MFDVEYMEGEKPVQFEDVKYTSAQIQASFISSLYEWPFVSGLTDSNCIYSFIETLICRYFSNYNSLGYFMYIFKI